MTGFSSNCLHTLFLESLTCETEVKDDNEFRFNNLSTHESNSCQNGILILIGTETTIIIMSQVCMKI